MTWLLLTGIMLLVLAASPLFAAVVANNIWPRYASQERREYEVAAATHIYRDTFVGKDPAGYLHSHVPGLYELVGIAYEEVDNSAGAAGALKCQVQVLGDWELTLTSVGRDDAGKPVYVVDNNTLSLTGHPLSYAGRIVHKTATNKCVVRLKAPGETAPSGQGSVTLKLTGHEPLEPTGATAGDGWLGGFEYESILGPGFVNNDEEDGGLEMEFDATAEVALSSIRTPNDIFPVDKGLRLSVDLNITDKGDNAAIDVDVGLGTALTTNSEADVDHVDMVQLAALHIDGNSLNLNVQSDNNTTDVAATDSTVDFAEGTPFHLDVCVAPDGETHVWVDGVDLGDADHANVSLQVLSTALLAAFLNVEKTSNDTTFRMVVKNLVVTAGMVAA